MSIHVGGKSSEAWTDSDRLFIVYCRLPGDLRILTSVQEPCCDQHQGAITGPLVRE